MKLKCYVCKREEDHTTVASAYTAGWDMYILKSDSVVYAFCRKCGCASFIMKAIEHGETCINVLGVDTRSTSLEEAIKTLRSVFEVPKRGE